MQNNFGGFQNRGNMNMNSSTQVFPGGRGFNNQPQANNFQNNTNIYQSNQNLPPMGNESSFSFSQNISPSQSQTIPLNRGMMTQVNNNMMQSGQIQRKKLHINLTQEESKFFSYLFDLIDKQKTGRLEAKEAATFMKTSGLPKATLKNIWLIASQTSNSFLDREEFYVALRLIALAQNNMPFNAQCIEMNNPIPPLPNFNIKKDEQNTQNINNGNNFNTSNNANIYEISENEKIYLKRFFDENKEQMGDKISARKAIVFWKNNGGSDPNIKTVATILKPLEQKGFLNLREFQVASHLMFISNQNGVPSQLPDNLVNYLGRNTNVPRFTEINNNRLNLGVPEKSFQRISSGNSSSATNIFMSNQISNNPLKSDNILKNTQANPNYNTSNSNSNIQRNETSNNIEVGDKIQKSLKRVDELNQRNENLNTQITNARSKMLDLLKEIDSLQKEKDSIKDELNGIKQELINLKSNSNSNYSNSNNISSKNINNYNSNNTNSNINNNYNNYNRMNNQINQENQNSNPKPFSSQGEMSPAQKEEYEALAKKKQDIMNFMAKMNMPNMMNQREEDKPKEENYNNPQKDLSGNKNENIDAGLPPIQNNIKDNIQETNNDIFSTEPKIEKEGNDNLSPNKGGINPYQDDNGFNFDDPKFDLESKSSNENKNENENNRYNSKNNDEPKGKDEWDLM